MIRFYEKWSNNIYKFTYILWIISRFVKFDLFSCVRFPSYGSYFKLELLSFYKIRGIKMMSNILIKIKLISLIKKKGKKI